MIQQLLLTSFFINNKTNQIQQLSRFLVETPTCEFIIAALHHYSCLCNNGSTLILNILSNLLLSSARLESNCQVHIQRHAEHISSSPAIVITSHCIASHLHSEATMMPDAIHSQQETLICMLTQQGSPLAVAQVVLSFLLSLLIYAFGVWEAVNVSM